MSTLTQDGFTRFNPNMYREGKVCLSILNTWHVGDKWSGCQSLTSVLLSIMGSVLIQNPLTAEPGFEDGTRKQNASDENPYEIYTRMVLHANIQTAVLNMIKNPPDFARPFYDIMSETFQKKRLRLNDLAVSNIDYDNKTEVMEYFRMKKTYAFSTLGDKLLLCSPINMISE
jgi:hypothetical protein